MFCVYWVEQWLKMPAWKVRDLGFEPHSGTQVSKKNNSPFTRKDSIAHVWSLCDRDVASFALDRQRSNFESCVWRVVSSHLSHHPREALLAQFSLSMYVHKMVV